MSDDDTRRTLAELRTSGMSDDEIRAALARLEWWMTHCWTCNGEVAWEAEVCEHCGEELMTHGKH